MAESPSHDPVPADDSEEVPLRDNTTVPSQDNGTVSYRNSGEVSFADNGSVVFQDSGTSDTMVLCQEVELEDPEAMNGGDDGRSPTHVKVTLMGSLASFGDDLAADLASKWDHCLVFAVGACYVFHPVVLALLSTVGAFIFLTPRSPEELPLAAFPTWNIVLLVSIVVLTISLVYGTIKKNPWLLAPHLLLHTVLGYLAVVVIQRGFSLSFSIFIILNFCSVFFMTIWSVCFGTEDDTEMNKCLKWIIIFLGVFSLMGVLLALMAETGSLEPGNRVRGPNYRDRWRLGSNYSSGHSNEESRFGGGFSDPKEDDSSIVLDNPKEDSRFGGGIVDKTEDGSILVSDHTEEESRFGGGLLDKKKNGSILVSDHTEEESRFGGGLVDKKENGSIIVTDHTKEESRFGGGWYGA